MHLYVWNEQTYHIHEDAVNKDDDTVFMCNSCFIALNLSINGSQVAPKQTFKAYDVGRIPSHLPDFTLIEIIAISPALCFHTVYHLRPMASGVSQKALRGNSICLPLSKLEGHKTDKTNLPRTDLADYVKVAFIGTKQV